MNFALDVDKFIKKVGNNSNQVFQKVCFELSTSIIKDTPVLSGRLRNSWFPSIGTPSTDKGEGGADESTGRVQNLTQTLTVDDTFNLTNNMPYAYRIEFEGWSQKAPKGMVRINLMRWQKFVDNAVKATK